jgi:hypothetical protein
MVDLDEELKLGCFVFGNLQIWLGHDANLFHTVSHNE